MKKFYSLSICLALFFSVLIVGNLEAASYYIDGSNGNDNNSGTLVSPWKTIGKANSTLGAGDTAYIRAGTYSTSINPTKNGTSGNLITYEAYTGETPIIIGATYGVYLVGSAGSERQHLSIKGLTFRKPSGTNRTLRWLHFYYADYITMEDCTFEYGDENFNYYMCFLENCDYLKFINCSWDASNINESSDTQNDLMGITAIKYSLWENCAFGHVSHQQFWFRGTANNYNVINNCTFTNKWRNGLSIRGDRNLVQNCVFQDMGTSCDTCPWFSDRCTSGRVSGGFQLLSSDYSIIRRNVWDYVSFGLYPNYAYGDIENIRIYNNTFYDANAPDAATNYHNGTHLVGSSLIGTFQYNVIANNVFWKCKNNNQIELYSTGSSIYHPHDNVLKYNLVGDPTNPDKAKWGGTTNTITYFEKNDSEWIHGTHVTADPLFTDTATGDFSLQQGSPCIDAGTWLTIVTSDTANGQTAFTVDDASYFYDGWGIPREIGDEIRTQNGQKTTITSINYDSNTITVSPAIDIVNGEGLALNYSGSAPDIGRHEYGSSIAPPAYLRLLSGN